MATALARGSLAEAGLESVVALRGVEAEVVKRVSSVSREYRRRRCERMEVILNQHCAEGSLRDAQRGQTNVCTWIVDEMPLRRVDRGVSYFGSGVITGSAIPRLACFGEDA